MRSETEMFDLILSFAKNDERVRAVIMNGSRTDENAPIDRFQDYDIVYIVNDIASFEYDDSWIDYFGDRIILQMPERMRDPIGDGRLTYLMLFKDENRIDLQVYPIEKWQSMIEKSSLTITLLDKDNILPKFPPAIDCDYIVKKPSETDIFDTRNEFWWCLQNVVKGIMRNELSYVKTSLDVHVRDQLNNMLTYYIGTLTNFSVSVGKFGKYYKKYLPYEIYCEYQKTYANSDYQDIWDSIFNMCTLFEKISKSVCTALQYNFTDYSDMLNYLHRIKAQWDEKNTLQT